MLQICSAPPAHHRDVDTFMRELEARNPGQPEFLQAAREVVSSLMPLVLDTAAYREHRVLERLTEPDRVLIFRVTWEDDGGSIHVNRAWRVQFNNAIGPYKGGLRFRGDLTLSVLKFLGFEQVFKNSLTGLPMGGAKGGADFDPRGRSDREVMRFCQAFMTELCRHIGEDTDVPAGDIGVGAREVSYLFGQYKRLANRFTGMPCTLDAVTGLQAAGVLFAPGKAANAGGVAVSGLEQSQNAQRLSWAREEVDARLSQIMCEIHRKCVADGTLADGTVDYVRGANVAGFRKVADAMVAHGIS